MRSVLVAVFLKRIAVDWNFTVSANSQTVDSVASCCSRCDTGHRRTKMSVLFVSHL